MALGVERALPLDLGGCAVNVGPTRARARQCQISLPETSAAFRCANAAVKRCPPARPNRCACGGDGVGSAAHPRRCWRDAKVYVKARTTSSVSSMEIRQRRLQRAVRGAFAMKAHRLLANRLDLGECCLTPLRPESRRQETAQQTRVRLERCVLVKSQPALLPHRQQGMIGRGSRSCGDYAASHNTRNYARVPAQATRRRRD